MVDTVELVVDGRAELLAAADAAAEHHSLEDVWAGRAPSQKLTRACGLCGHFQNVTIPFLRRECAGCHGTWLPARCRSCATTVIAAIRDEDTIYRGTCICGGVLEGLAGIPRQRVARTATEVRTNVAQSKARRRRWHRRVDAFAVAVTLVAGVGTVALLRAQEHPALAKPTGAPTATAAVGNTPQARGKAAAGRIRASGDLVNLFSCQAQYLDENPSAASPASTPTNAPPAPGPVQPSSATSSVDSVYLDACLSA